MNNTDGYLNLLLVMGYFLCLAWFAIPPVMANDPVVAAGRTPLTDDDEPNPWGVKTL